MASPFDGIDIEDPCAVWPVLEKARLELVAGAKVSSTRFGPDEVRFAKSDMPALDREIARLKAECQAKQSGRPARRAIRAGFRY